ncbi:MAG: hypothetical protein ACRERE_18765 [Candidatus Entotheonellia bacterium]
MSQDLTAIGSLQLIAEHLVQLTENQDVTVRSLQLIAERLAQLTESRDVTVTGNLELIVEPLTQLSAAGKPSMVWHGPTGGTGPEEETIVRMSLGTGTVRHGIDGRTYFVVHGHLVGVDGAPDGEFEGVWAAQVFTPQDLVSYPEPPTPPFDRPFKPGEVGWSPALNPTKAKWTFAHGHGWLEAVGPALSRVQIQSDGHTQFWYSVAAFVTSGGGVYEGVRGQATSMGSAYFLAVPQPLEGLSFELNAIHVLKVVRPR